AAALAATAAPVKPQFGVVLIPLVAIVLIKRHLTRPGSGPRHPPWAPAAMAGWLAQQQGWPRLATSLAAALLAFFVLALPFGLGIVEYLRLMTETAGGYSWLSVNAFNAWALLGSDGTLPLAESLRWSDDTVPLLGPLAAVVIGAALLAAGFLWGVVRAAARDDRWTLLVAVTFLAIAFFILPTRVHERYIFPAIALLPLLAVANGRWAVALLLLSAGAFINLHAILTIDLYGTANVTSLPAGELFRTQPFIVASVILQTGVGLWAAWQLRPSLRTSPDAFDRAAAPPPAAPPGTAPGTYPVVVAGAPAAPQPDPAASVAQQDEDWVRGPSAFEWIMARFTRPPLRRDRSAELKGERGGRIDRLDLLLFVVLIIGAATLRGVNLDKPYAMYFDEVYHARTATEFLQRWEYGVSHDIYEFTHPHLAKYAIAWGIRLAGGNEISGTADLGVDVVGAAIERRWAGSGSARSGDRLYIGTGQELRVYDLATRDSAGNFPIEATALAVDDEAHRLYIADRGGALFVLDTTVLDARRNGSGGPGGLEAFAAGPGGPIDSLVVTDVSLIALAADGSINAWDLETSEPLARRVVDGSADAVALPWADRLVVDTPRLDDVGKAARLLADALDDDAARIEALLGSGPGSVVVGAYLDEDTRSSIESLIDDDGLTGVRLEGGPLLAIAGASGIDVLDAYTLDVIEESLLSSATTSLVLVERGLPEPTLYATAGSSLEVIAIGEDGPALPKTVSMPGEVRDVVWNEPANLVHVLGDAPQDGPTVYVVEPNGNAVFIDVPLPAEPGFLLADTQPERPADDRGELLAIASDGVITNVGIEGNAFGWRIPGVLLGALGTGLLYLLARVLFARRSVGIIAAVLMLAEGMMFANSRIAMNDVYVGTFIIAAVLLFAPLYLAPRRALTAVPALLAVGLVLGLALASKWVALYAIGGLLLLVLLRSGLGRVLALVGMVVMSAVLGAMAIRPAAVDDPNQNWTFLILMLSLTGLLTVAMVRRPLAITGGEVWLAVLGPVLIGSGLLILGVARPATWTEIAGTAEGSFASERLALAGGLAMAVGLAALLVTWVATRFGLGPFSEGARPPDTSTSGWLRPGWLGGLPWLFTLAALVLVPIGVYVISYAPWVDLGNQWGLPLIGSLPFLPAGEAGQAGQTFPELTLSMYQYHDNLRAEHAASSPWWAWPFDLKPVWFYQQRFAGSTTGLIYDTGNLVIFWMGLPALAWTAWTAWRRRSAALALVVLMWAALLLPWARIDRATFQYHVYASLPFLILALSYFLAELWHGPGPRTWFLARIAAALAIVAVPLLWLFRTPLCILAGTSVANPDGIACASEVSRTAQLSEAGIAAAVVVAVGAGFAGLLAWRASRLPPNGGEGLLGGSRALAMAALVVLALGTLAGVLAALLLLDSSAPTAVTFSSDVLALLGLGVLAIPAWMTIRARDSRRYVVGVVGAASLWLVVWYPNISGLPLPSDLAHLYQVLLPTWNWDFQFAVNTDPALPGSAIDLSTLVVAAAAVVLVIGVAIVAHLWGRSSSVHE
ncbi:MAG: phospholipid carrier-dependent glycosyltransferase, partial [Chloroflexota bacterium]